MDQVVEQLWFGGFWSRGEGPGCGQGLLEILFAAGSVLFFLVVVQERGLHVRGGTGEQRRLLRANKGHGAGGVGGGARGATSIAKWLQTVLLMALRTDQHGATEAVLALVLADEQREPLDIHGIGNVESELSELLVASAATHVLGLDIGGFFIFLQLMLVLAEAAAKILKGGGTITNHIDLISLKHSCLFSNKLTWFLRLKKYRQKTLFHSLLWEDHGWLMLPLTTY